MRQNVALYGNGLNKENKTTKIYILVAMPLCISLSPIDAFFSCNSSFALICSISSMGGNSYA